MPETARQPILYQSGMIGALPAGKSPGVELLSDTMDAWDTGAGLPVAGGGATSASSTVTVGITGGPEVDATGRPDDVLV